MSARTHATPAATAADDDILDAEVVEDADTDTEAAPEPKKPSLRERVSARIGPALATWWIYIAKPMSVREAWLRSGSIDVRRIPGDSKLLFWWWWWSNRVDRPLLFLLLGIVPTWANGPLLWCALRPSRRWGLYVIAAFILITLPSIAGS